jgi:hypothetical protein
MKVILFGATGTVGQGVLRECRRDTAICSRLGLIHSPGREAAVFSSPVRERGVRKSIQQLERRRCDTNYEGSGCRPSRASLTFCRTGPRPYGTWLFNVGHSGPMVAATKPRFLICRCYSALGHLPDRFDDRVHAWRLRYALLHTSPARQCLQWAAQSSCRDENDRHSFAMA